jgi:predicted nucleic-acid-binding protein
MAGQALTPTGLKVIDTNIVTRIVIQDDPAQVASIETLLQQSLFVPMTVLLETVWVLSSNYRMERSAIADALVRLLDLSAIQVESPDLIVWAIERFRAGADFGDMLHLVAGRGGEAFVTFDRGVAKAAKTGSPMPVITLRS